MVGGRSLECRVDDAMLRDQRRVPVVLLSDGGGSFNVIMSRAVR